MKDQMISIIEDDLSVREALEVLLKSAGMKYQSFDSAEQFLIRIQSWSGKYHCS